METFKTSNRRYWTKKDLAKELRVTEVTIDNWRRNGSLPYIKMGNTTNSKVLFDIVDIQEFFERRKLNVGERRHLQGLHRANGFQPKEEDYAAEDKDDTYIPDQNYDMPPDIY